MTISPALCSDIIREYDAQGWHRTATPVDEESATWLVERLRQAGVDATTDRFPFSRVDAGVTTVAAGDDILEAYPLIDSTLPPEGTTISGQLASADGGQGAIWLDRTDGHGEYTSPARSGDSEYEAIIVAVDGPDAATTLLNAWQFDNPGGPPVVQVRGADWERLDRARGIGEAVTVRLGATRIETTAANVFARIEGTARDGRQPLAVLTPRSGWWQCASERGGGIAAWIGLGAVIAAEPLARDVLFVATSGHELGFVGAKRHFDHHPGQADGTPFWMHLGANIGAAGARPMVRSGDEALLDLARGAGFEGATYDISRAPVGEAGVVHGRGGRFVSLVGAGAPYFHSTRDRWPAAIDAEAISGHANAVLRVLRAADGSL